MLKAYPWFYNRLMNSGCDPKKELLEVGPMPHSFSGGIKVDRNYASNVPGLYAVGEACGGIHGACRCAGNAASQATLSGLLCAEGIMRSGDMKREIGERPVSVRRDGAAMEKFLPELRNIASCALGVFRDGPELEKAIDAAQNILDNPDAAKDGFTMQTALSIQLIARAALNRKESRGTHNRLDFPETNPEYEKEFTI